LKLKVESLVMCTVVEIKCNVMCTEVTLWETCSATTSSGERDMRRSAGVLPLCTTSWTHVTWCSTDERLLCRLWLLRASCDEETSAQVCVALASDSQLSRLCECHSTTASCHCHWHCQRGRVVSVYVVRHRTVRYEMLSTAWWLEQISSLRKAWALFLSSRAARNRMFLNFYANFIHIY